MIPIREDTVSIYDHRVFFKELFFDEVSTGKVFHKISKDCPKKKPILKFAINFSPSLLDSHQMSWFLKHMSANLAFLLHISKSLDMN